MDKILDNEYISESLSHMTGYELVMRITAFILIISLIIGFAISIYRLVEKYRKRRNILEERDNMIKKHEEQIDKLCEENKELDRNVNEILNKIDVLTSNVQELKQYNDSNECAKLKDRIAQSYMIHSKTKEITKMQKESLEGLITAYEKYNQNSFVHEIVQKEMYTWRVVDENGGL